MNKNIIKEPRFVHLKLHSDYSIIDGLSKINDIVHQAVKLQMASIAITDFNNLFGLIKFYNAANKSGIKPIIGADFLLRNQFLGKELFEITILASNNIGYKNLLSLISLSYKKGYVGGTNPSIDQEWLLNLNKGLILISGAQKGDLGKCLLKGNLSKIKKILTFYKKNFPNRYYLEIVRTGRYNEEKYLEIAVNFSINEELPIVATNDVRFIKKKDFHIHEMRVAIQKGSLISEKQEKIFSTQQYMRNEKEMCELFSDLPESLINSVEIAKRCSVKIKLGEHFLPKFPTKEISSHFYLVKKSYKGLEEKLIFLFPDINERKNREIIYQKRLKNELNIIDKIGLSSYFLIVMEFVQWAKKKNIPVGPGRGSGAGSLVAYVLKITNIDPIMFDLLFERFLNPERKSMPDFDIDFCMEKRDLVIEHVIKKYGRESVAQIITFGTMTAKSVIKDVGRTLGYPYSFVDKLSKLIPSTPGITLKSAFLLEPILKKMCNTDEEVKMLVDMSCKLEGVVKNIGKHAGGVVISPSKITDFSPLYCDEKGDNNVTQFDKEDIEKIGLIKFDFLGLKTLTIINNAMKMINFVRKLKNNKEIDISNIPLNDKKSFDLLQSCKTIAIFQLESRGMQDLIRKLKPDCFEDIIALVALFRPGPLQSGMVDNFINRKHGKEFISYPDIKWQHKSLEPILKSTYGIILYQEQVMKIAQILANYTPSQADILRQAMVKKDPIEMSKQRFYFKSRSKNIGIDSMLSMKIFDLLEKFAGYGFNKAHSAAYSLISYQTLWIKANYPEEFMSAVMTADMDNTEKIIILVDECLRMGIKILPPNINKGEYYFFSNKKKEILYGIGAVKGIGKTIIKKIIEERKKNGTFFSLFNLCTRCNLKKTNYKMLETLIMSGTLDCLEKNRDILINSLNSIFRASIQYATSMNIGQQDIFGIQEKEIKISFSKEINTFFNEKKIMEGEKKTIGFYLTNHPITKYLSEVKKYPNYVRLKDIHNLNMCNKVVTIIGLVTYARIITTKKIKQIGIYKLDDTSKKSDVILFGRILDQYRDFLKKDKIFIVQGKINFDSFRNEMKIIAYNIMDINTAREKYIKKISILLNSIKLNEKYLKKLILLFQSFKTGNIPIYFFLKNKNKINQFLLKKNWYLKPNDKLISSLFYFFEKNQIKITYN